MNIEVLAINPANASAKKVVKFQPRPHKGERSDFAAHAKAIADKYPKVMAYLAR